MAMVRGQHWLLDCSDCTCDRALLAERERLERECIDACTAAGMQVMGSAFHQFVPEGVTGVVLLAESHLSVHTWPDERFAAIDVYVCNHDRDNTGKGAALAACMQALFGSERCALRQVSRESVETIARPATTVVS